MNTIQIIILAKTNFPMKMRYLDFVSKKPNMIHYRNVKLELNLLKTFLFRYFNYSTVITKTNQSIKPIMERVYKILKVNSAY